LLKHTLLLIHLYGSRADFLKKANLKKIGILKGFEKFYNKAIVEAEAAQKIIRQQWWGKCAKPVSSVICSVSREKYILPPNLSLYTINIKNISNK
jgi:hypothetical protein